MTNRFIPTKHFGSMRFVKESLNIPVHDWALPGEPFRLVAVAVTAADWSRQVPAAAVARLERFADPMARARAGASEWLKACWLPTELGVDRLDYAVGTNGKPMLVGPLAEWGFNLSHAGTHAVAVVARGAAVGVDLESRSRKADVVRLAQRVFSESEQALVQNGGRDAFFSLWSQKEALMKALGCGWADGKIQRRTKLRLADYQVEPATGARVWTRRALEGSHMLAVALI